MSGRLQKALDATEEKLIFQEVGKVLSDKHAELTEETFAFQNLKSLTMRYQSEYDEDTNGSTPKCEKILSQCHYYLALCYQRMRNYDETLNHYLSCVQIHKALTSYTMTSKLALLTLMMDAYMAKWELSDDFLARLFVMREKMGVFYNAVHAVYKVLLPDAQHARHFLHNYIITSARLYYMTGLVQCGLGQFNDAVESFQQACLKLNNSKGSSMVAMATYGLRRCLDINQTKSACEEGLDLKGRYGIHRGVIDNAIMSYGFAQFYEAFNKKQLEGKPSSIIAANSIPWFFSGISGSASTDSPGHESDIDENNSNNGPRKRVRTGEPNAGAGAG